jgi:histidinol-phosphate/aromatic aminotransferase/cobyric acid decarboxylase-like protein
LVVLRTLSKAWGVAGLRFGVTLAHPTLMAYLLKVLAPYPLGSHTITVVRRLLEGASLQGCAERIGEIIAVRDAFIAQLKKLPIVDRILPSDTNYVTFRAHCKDRVLAKCQQAGIVVRDRSTDAGLGGFLRVSIGKESDMEKLVQLLAQLSANEYWDAQ